MFTNSFVKDEIYNIDKNNQLNESVLKLKESLQDEKIIKNQAQMDEIFLKIKELEKQMILPIILCLTYADKENAEGRSLFIKQLKTHKKLTNYFGKKKLDIVFMGCADHKFSNFGSEQQYSNTLELVTHWRNNLFQKYLIQM